MRTRIVLLTLLVALAGCSDEDAGDGTADPATPERANPEPALSFEVGALPTGWKEIETYGGADRRFIYEEQGVPFARASMKQTEAGASTIDTLREELTSGESVEGIELDLISFQRRPLLGLEDCALVRTKATMPEGYARTAPGGKLALPEVTHQHSWYCIEGERMYMLQTDVQPAHERYFTADFRLLARRTKLVPPQ